MLFPDSLFVASLGLTVMVAIFAVGFEIGHYLGRRRVTRTDWNDGYEAGRRSGYLAGKRDNQPRERNGRFTKQEIAP